MRTHRRIVVGVVLGVLVALWFSLWFFTKGPGQQPVSDAPSVLPEFAFPDAAGAMVTLADLDAPVRVVNFWASWSPYSASELPALVRLKREFGGKVAVAAVNRDTNSAEGQAFLASLDLGTDLVFAYDKEDAYFKEVGGYAMPETIFVDEEGAILAHVHGPMTYEDMRAQVETLLSSE